MLTRFALLALTCSGLFAATASAADANIDRTRKLIEVLNSNAPFFEKARACQQLGEFGTREAVPSLAALLDDEHLCAYARSGLEGIPDPSAAEALRAAAARLTGDRLAAVVESLGVLRDAKAVDLLHKLADTPASGASQQAILALGRIANEEAIRILRERLVDRTDRLLTSAATSEGTRTNAAAACLLAAERQLAEGRAEAAVALYDAVIKANVPVTYRAAALRGAIVAQKTQGVPLLIEHLRSKEPVLRNAALTTIREIPSEALARALNAEIERAPADLQKQLLVALVDCPNPQSLKLLQAKTEDRSPEIRATALASLGKIGGANGVGALVKALAANRSAEESAIAIGALGRMQGAEIDRELTVALASSKDAKLREKLIPLLATRSVTNAVPELVKQAADSDVKVSVAALSALQSLAGLREVAALMAVVKGANDPAVREAAESAVVGVFTRTDNALPGAEAILGELKKTTDPLVKISWVNILVSLGKPEALSSVLATMDDPSEVVVGNSLEQLARWPDPAPVESLLAIAQKDGSPARRKKALVSAIRLTTVAADEHQRPVETLVGWFQQANDGAQTVEDRRLVISGLGRLADPTSLQLLVPYLPDPNLQQEAAVAIVQIAPALRQEDPAALSEALDQVVSVAKSQELRNSAAKIAKSIPEQGRRTVLFDGRSLAGWNGNTSVWRVQDGVIVGGSTNGNPRNEFLTTSANSSNFILRLEYKLVGTGGFVNGGVQFRSVRVKEPANEMSGFQADVGAGYSGCLYDESRRNKFLVQAPADQIKRLERPGDWNRYEVRCSGPRIQILLNGEKTVDYIENDPAIPLDGMIGLQIHGACKAEISFRNITIEQISYGTANRAFGLKKDGWEVLSFSSENTQVEDERAVLAIDGDPGTFWHTLWSGGAPGHPHYIAVDMMEEAQVTGFTYLPRQDGRQVKGVIDEFEFYVSRDSNIWGQPVAKGRFDKIDTDPSGRVVLLPRPVRGRFFKLMSLSAPGGEPYAGAAEIGILGLLQTDGPSADK